jgi:hypothetical protein
VDKNNHTLSTNNHEFLTDGHIHDPVNILDSGDTIPETSPIFTTNIYKAQYA